MRLTPEASSHPPVFVGVHHAPLQGSIRLLAEWRESGSCLAAAGSNIAESIPVHTETLFSARSVADLGVKLLGTRDFPEHLSQQSDSLASLPTMYKCSIPPHLFLVLNSDLPWGHIVVSCWSLASFRVLVGWVYILGEVSSSPEFHFSGFLSLLLL